MLKLATCAAAALAVTGFAAPAMAETESMSVDFADLDLTSAADVEVLQERIELAAERVCRLANVHSGVTSIRRCRLEAVEAAQEQMEHFIEMAGTQGAEQLAVR